MATFNTSSSGYKALRNTDKDFFFSPNGITVVPRAGFEIDGKCPSEYRMILNTCLQRGWIRPVAHMLNTEYLMEKLKS